MHRLLNRTQLSFLLLTETRCHHSHTQLTFEPFINSRSDHHRRIISSKLANHIANFFELTDSHIETRSDVDKNATCTGEINIFQERAGNSHLSGFRRTIVPTADPRTHHRQTHFTHDGAHIRKVNVDKTRIGNELSYALNRTAKYIIGSAERIQQADIFSKH